MKRILRKLKVSGARILESERWGEIKCFHAGEEAKWWLPDAERAGILKRGPEHVGAGVTAPFVELTRSRYGFEQGAKQLLRAAGYYRLFAAQ